MGSITTLGAGCALLACLSACGAGRLVGHADAQSTQAEAQHASSPAQLPSTATSGQGLGGPFTAPASPAGAEPNASHASGATGQTFGRWKEPPRIDQSELGKPRIGAVAEHVWIKPKPSHVGLALGKVRIGTSVALQSAKPVAGQGCPKGWYRVQPRGYVCLNDDTTIALAEDDYYQALHAVAPRIGEVWPYNYGHSRGAPMYSRVPAPHEWRKKEAQLGPPGSYQEMGDWAKGHEELIDKGRPIEATGPVPWYFAGGKRHVGGGHRSTRQLQWHFIPNGSMVAYARAFEMHGRIWLVTPDLMLVPADRVQYLKRSKFVGTALRQGAVRLPIAFNRHHGPRPIYQKRNGRFVASSETLAGKTWRMLDANKRGLVPKGFYAIRNRPGRFLKAEDITIAWQRKKYPPGIRHGEKWVDVHITPGTLVAYEGLKPVYATMFSPGKGGQPVKGNDHEVYATTATGNFRLQWKEYVATMSNEKGAPKVMWFSDVPYIQYIQAPLAMHVAFWHEDFGNPKSAECVNVSPRDGLWLFGWTDPQPPPGWGAVGAGRGMGRSTPFMINGF